MQSVEFTINQGEFALSSPPDSYLSPIPPSSNGLLDPWSGGSPLAPTAAFGKRNVIFNITLGAHHLDLRGSHPAEPPQAHLVRNKEKHVFRAWLEAFKEEAGRKVERVKHLRTKEQVPSTPL